MSVPRKGSVSPSLQSPDSVDSWDTHFDNLDGDDDSNSSAAASDQQVDQFRGQSDKRQLLQDHLALIRKEAAGVRESRKIFLRRHLKELRERIQNGRENGVDPLYIFPKEVWCMILKYLTEPKDLDSCAKTCQLFQNILKDTAVERLFGKTFPLVYNYLPGVKHGFTDDIKNCRLACKQLRVHVDRFLETDTKTQTKYSNNTGNLLGKLEEEPNPLFGAAPFVPGHAFGFPMTPEGFRARPSIYNPELERMRLHPGNPFVGRSILARAMNPDFGDQSPFNDELGKLLDDLGQHIHHLELSSDYGFVFDSTSEYYRSVVQCMAKCPNLKTLQPFDFHMNGVADDDGNVSPNSRRKIQLELPDHNSLDSLIIRPAIREHVVVLQDALIQKYSGQLRNLYVLNWRDYHLLPWGNLRRLFIHCDLGSHLAHSLMRTYAPNLQHLQIGLCKDGAGLKQLLQLVSHFQCLNHLEVTTNGYELYLEDEILSISPALACSTSALTTFTIWARPGLDSSYDFLICFPFLKRLVFMHEWRVGLRNHENSQDNEDEFGSSEVVYPGEREDSDEEMETESGDEDGDDEECANVAGETTKCRLTKLAEYLWRKPDAEHKEWELENIYRSNVWEILPSLETLETVVQVVPWIGERENILRMAHTRQGYNLRKWQSLPSSFVEQRCCKMLRTL